MCIRDSSRAVLGEVTRDLSLATVNRAGRAGIAVELRGRDNFTIEDDRKLILWAHLRTQVCRSVTERGGANGIEFQVNHVGQLPLRDA